MKNKILISVILPFAVILGGGVVAAVSLSNATERMEKLILLHQVEILREDLIIRIEQVQSYLYRNKIRSGGDVDTLNARVQEMDRAMASCLGCHHSPERTQGLLGMRDVAGDYKQAISRLVTASANSTRIMELERRTQDLGRDLIAMTQGMAFSANVSLHQKTQAAMRFIRGIKNILYATLALGIVLAVITVYFLIANLNRRLQTVTEAAKRISRGDLGHRVESIDPPGSEFMALSDAFNAMTRNLFLSRRSLEQCSKLSAAGELAATVSRELHDPLAGILKKTDALLSAEGISGEGRESLKAIARDTVACRDFLNRIEEFSRQPQPHLAKTDITALVRDVIMQLQQQARNNKVEVVFECPADLPYVAVDGDQMKRVFSHLTVNAIRAMPEGGALLLRCRQEKDAKGGEVVIVEYVDTGSGLHDEEIDKIFYPSFLMPTKGEKTSDDLAVSYVIVQRHRGRIEVESTPGKGSTFRVILPA